MGKSIATKKLSGGTDDGCVVNEARIHAAVVSEVVASFAHKEYNMEVVLNSSIKLRQEHLVFDLLVFAFLARLLHHSANNLFHFLCVLSRGASCHALFSRATFDGTATCRNYVATCGWQ